MKLKDLVQSGLVNDSDIITVVKPLIGNACDMRKGNWLNDQVLEFMSAEIQAFSWNEDRGYSIALK